MRFIYICGFFFFGQVLFSQDINVLRSADTVYIFFDKKGKFQEKKKYENTTDEFIFNGYYFYFSEDNYKAPEIRPLIGFHPQKQNEFVLCKKGFNKKKNNTIGIDFFLKIGLQGSYYLLENKVLFIVDDSKKKNKKIKLQRVNMFTIPIFSREE